MTPQGAGDHKICLVCSSGGHLFQLNCLEPFWSDKSHFWVSFPTQDAKYLLSDEKVYWAHYPTNRSVINFFRNFLLAKRILSSERPSVIVSTGAGVCVPFIVLSKLMGIRSIYVESITRNESISLSGRLVYYFVDEFLVQWPELAQRYSRAKYHGKVI